MVFILTCEFIIWLCIDRNLSEALELIIDRPKIETPTWVVPRFVLKIDPNDLNFRFFP